MSETMIHDAEAKRFRIPLADGAEAYLEYTTPAEGTFDLRHTVVPAQARGEGLGTDLIRQTLDHIRDRGQRIVPTCTFVRAFLADHPEYRELEAA
jgi:uncharacterized protein